jgi:hypothetical protein
MNNTNNITNINRIININEINNIEELLIYIKNRFNLNLLTIAFRSNNIWYIPYLIKLDIIQINKYYHDINNYIDDNIEYYNENNISNTSINENNISNNSINDSIINSIGNDNVSHNNSNIIDDEKYNKESNEKKIYKLNENIIIFYGHKEINFKINISTLLKLIIEKIIYKHIHDRIIINLRHSINQPLENILNLLIDTKPDINKYGLILSSNIFNFIDYYNFDHVINIKSINLLECIKSINQIIHSSFNKIFDYHIDNSIPKLINTDERIIKQIIISLLINSISWYNKHNEIKDNKILDNKNNENIILYIHCNILDFEYDNYQYEIYFDIYNNIEYNIIDLYNNISFTTCIELSKKINGTLKYNFENKCFNLQILI